MARTVNERAKRAYRKVHWFITRTIPLAIREKDVRFLRASFRRASVKPEILQQEVIMLYHKNFGTTFDFHHPVTHNQKISVRKLSDDPRMPMLADKYAVRDYVREKVGEKYLVPLLFYGEDFTEADFQQLPAQFIVKATHGSRMNFLVMDKEKVKVGDIIRHVRKTLNTRFGMYSMELFYNKIPPRVIVEELLLDKDNTIPSPKRFHVFPYAENGQGRIFIQTHLAIGKTRTQDFYDEHWRRCPFRQSDFTEHAVEMPRLENLDEMLEVAKKLAADLQYVRVDLYNLEGKIYFSEMTFTPNAATRVLHPPEYEEIWGNLWQR